MKFKLNAKVQGKSKSDLSETLWRLFWILWIKLKLTLTGPNFEPDFGPKFWSTCLGQILDNFFGLIVKPKTHSHLTPLFCGRHYNWQISTLYYYLTPDTHWNLVNYVSVDKVPFVHITYYFIRILLVKVTIGLLYRDLEGYLEACLLAQWVTNILLQLPALLLAWHLPYGQQGMPPGPVGYHYSHSATSPIINSSFALWANMELYILVTRVTQYFINLFFNAWNGSWMK